MQTQDTIDAYVKGLLPPEEKAAFEAVLARDPELAEAVAQARFDLEVADLLIRDEVRSWLSTWAADEQWPELNSENRPGPASPPRFRRMYFWMAVAAVTIAVVAVIWFLRPETIHQTDPIAGNKTDTSSATPPVRPPGKDTLQPPVSPAPKARPNPAAARYIAMAEQSFQYQDTDTFLRGEKETPEKSRDSLDLVVTAFKNGQTDRAIRIAAAISPGNPQFAEIQLWLGQLYFQKKQYDRAAAALQRAIQIGTVGTDRSQWNLLMTYLAQYEKRKTEADALLQQITADEDHAFWEKAMELQASLKDF